MSCIVHSVRDEEERTTLFHLKQRRKSSPSLEMSSDRVGGCPAHRDEEVRRILEMADLGPRRTRSRGIQDVTAADKSEVGPAIRGPRGSGRVRPSVSTTASPGVSVVLVILWFIIHVASRGTLLRTGSKRDIPDRMIDYTCIMYLYVLSYLDSTLVSQCESWGALTPKSAKLLRWSLALQEFDIEVQYKKGAHNVVADWLSRQG